jgi:hypothetical protein
MSPTSSVRSPIALHRPVLGRRVDHHVFGLVMAEPLSLGAEQLALSVRWLGALGADQPAAASVLLE